MIRLLRAYLPRVRFLLLLLVAAQVGQALLMLYLPQITAAIIDKGVLRGDNHQIWHLGGQMLMVTFGQAVFMCAGVYLAARATMAVGRDLRQDMFHRVGRYSAREVGQFGTATLITRITNDVQQVQMTLQLLFTTAVVAPVTAVFGSIMAMRQDTPLSAILLVAVVVLAFFAFMHMRMSGPVFLAMQDGVDDVNRVLREQIAGLRVLRAFVREPAERDRFQAANGELTSMALRSGQLFAFLFPVVMIVQNSAGVAVVWLGAARIDGGQTSVGALFALLGYVTQVLMAAMMSTFVFAMLPRAAVAGHRIREVLETTPSVAPPTVPRDVPVAGSVEFRGVRFGYPGADAPVIDDVSFLAERGETTAVVGSTGAGKTTLLNLVPRLYDATGGTVLVGDVDVRDLESDHLWSRIGYVPQRPMLFSGTVASNLRFGAANATDDDLWAALSVAQAADFVAAMPGGLSATIAQGGTNVSGGQRQRLAIARALVRRPDIYLFDDCFSALDVATDARLRAALIPWTHDATVITVAQRVSTIVDAHRIVVLDEGRVVACGSHEDLLESSPTYREIVESQALAEAVA